MRGSLLLARLAGAREEILCRTPNDTPKYTALGGVIVSTAAVAALSATYALSATVGLPPWLAAPIGLGWGLVVLNLDRMLVVSMTRQNDAWRNVAAAAPRVLLAVVLGVVISTPLVLRMFQPEIETELVVMQNEDQQRSQEQMARTFARIPELQRRVDDLRGIASGQTRPTVADDPEVSSRQREFEDVDRRATEAEQVAICEDQGGPNCPGGSGQPGRAGLYFEKKAVADRLRAQANAAAERLDAARTAAEGRLATTSAERKSRAGADLTSAQADLDRALENRARFEAAANEASQNGGGLLARLEALDRLSSGRPSMQLAHGAVFLVFFLLELLPVIVKLLSMTGRPTLYEQLLERREAEVSDDDLAADRHRDEIHEERARVGLELERDRATQQIDAGREATAYLVETQKAISRRAVDVWSQVALARSDDELRRWYHLHTGHPLPESAPGPAAPSTNDAPTVVLPLQANTSPASHGSQAGANGSTP